MWLVLLCLVGNAAALAVGRYDRAAQRPTLRTHCSPLLAGHPPTTRPSSLGLGGAARRLPQVSNLGRVRTEDGIITEGYERRDGYRVASVNGKYPLVHRLVAQAFFPPPPSEKHTDVNHIDGDPANNRADNLEWGDCGKQTPAGDTEFKHATEEG